ncbi:hypothetical protein Q0F99_04870 [Rathayibacter oskolensis]|uniref:hypothetical protein n=1 Tax=Rathayibacter oskolensis TaxID=1891671 RepID=UPI00265F7D4B|nr:hypothetical protein [Rathayibacter oskolensis]WKK72325.1 hypothetical protein Q0F99_04870 [Rathayibacter oskolensis]
MPQSRSLLRALALGATVAATVSLVACSGPSDASSDSGDTVTVTVGTLRGQPHFYQPFLYEQFAEEGWSSRSSRSTRLRRSRTRSSPAPSTSRSRGSRRPSRRSPRTAT